MSAIINTDHFYLTHLFIPTRIYFAKNSVAIILIINKLENEIFANQFILSICISHHLVNFSLSTILHECGFKLKVKGYNHHISCFDCYDYQNNIQKSTSRYDISTWYSQKQ